MDAHDVQLVQRARAGEREAFGRLVDRHERSVYGLAWHLTGRCEDARDLAQEAFIRAYERLPQLREPEQFLGWLRRIAVNLHRSRARRRSVAFVPLAAASDVEDGSHAQRERDRAVHEALAGLAEPDRLALSLFYFGGYSHKDLADFLDLSPGAAKTRLARARARLREEVTRMFDDAFDAPPPAPALGADVMAGIGSLMRDLRDALPTDAMALKRSVYERRNALWREILAELPPELLARVAEQDQAEPTPATEFPDRLRERLRQAIHLTWLDSLLQWLTGQWPWLEDTDALWLRVRPRDGGRLGVSICDTPTDTHNGTSVMVALEPAAPPTPASPADRDTVQLLCALTRDIVSAADSLPTSLTGRAYERAGRLATTIAAEMEIAFQAVHRTLPGDFRRRMQAGERISARQFAPALRQAVERAIHLHAASRLLSAFSQPWGRAQTADGFAIEFGHCPDLPELGQSAGREYVKLRPLPGSPVTSNYQTGIYQRDWDEVINES